MRLLIMASLLPRYRKGLATDFGPSRRSFSIDETMLVNIVAPPSRFLEQHDALKSNNRWYGLGILELEVLRLCPGKRRDEEEF